VAQTNPLAQRPRDCVDPIQWRAEVICAAERSWDTPPQPRVDETRMPPSTTGRLVRRRMDVIA
jgi:hypothetical protein